MSYVALYRKWRPASFDEVKGQDHIVTTLKNQIKADRLGHAYLFCGTRGTGKTSVAKIFAKAVNCGHPTDGNPCGECDICKAMAAGMSLNVIEFDAASNNGVDDIRNIKEDVSYPPTEGRFKVYIIDEVHMLSVAAFNALLKTLEEPPPYVIFILATTEVHKIPVTILSRCQQYDFKRITIDTISRRLGRLMEAEGVDVEERALRYIAKAADGSMRDALSLLDQCISFNFGKQLKFENVLDILGAVDTEIFSGFYRKIIQRDSIGLMYMLEQIIIDGRELSQFVSDFTWYLRNLMLMASSEDAAGVIDLSEENLKLLKEDARLTDIDSIMRYIRIFSELGGQLRNSTQKRIMIEVALIRLMEPSMARGDSSVIERVGILERQTEELKKQLEEVKTTGVRVMAGAEAGSLNNAMSDASTRSEAKKPKPKPARSEEILEVIKNRRQICEGLSLFIKPVVEKYAVWANGGENKLKLIYNSGTQYSIMNTPENIATLEQIIADKAGVDIKIEVILVDSNVDVSIDFDTLDDVCKMTIEQED